ncbi:hypothetical protein J6590_009314 [Homalodisca vitripennis]|nr:hypothetical protein J6590_009314 [Homalodisca vitripennis]
MKFEVAISVLTNSCFRWDAVMATNCLLEPTRRGDDEHPEIINLVVHSSTVTKTKRAAAWLNTKQSSTKLLLFYTAATCCFVRRLKFLGVTFDLVIKLKNNYF